MAWETLMMYFEICHCSTELAAPPVPLQYYPTKLIVFLSSRRIGARDSLLPESGYRSLHRVASRFSAFDHQGVSQTRTRRDVQAALRRHRRRTDRLVNE